MRARTIPVEVTTDRADVYPQVLNELIPAALYTVKQYRSKQITDGLKRGSDAITI